MADVSLLPIPTTPTLRAATKNRSGTTSKGAFKDVKDVEVVTKRKQSKSRNGCVTCKAKRLKCDETKPTCQQCARRNVQCGGYRKDFKWRPFEETSFVSKFLPGKLKKSSPPPPPVQAPARVVTQAQPIPVTNSFDHDAIPLPQSHQPHHDYSHGHVLPVDSCSFPAANLFPVDSSYFLQSRSLGDHYEPSPATTMRSMCNDTDTMQSMTTAPSSLSSGQSPKLVDLLLPGTDLTATPPEYASFRAQYEDVFAPPALVPQNSMNTDFEDDDIEEIIRQSEVNPDHEAWVMRLPSPSPSSSSSGSSDRATVISRPMDYVYSIFQSPLFAKTSVEMVTLSFNHNTCGILSVKDGPTENPWRTLIYPLAKDCPALWYAIASMTSFHTCRGNQEQRLQGIEYMRTSIQQLAKGIQNMPYHTALATTLVLAFSESWDQHTSTGINHIKGARILMNNALIQHSRSSFFGLELRRLKFLCNTWVYMDVIARLTSIDADDSTDFDAPFKMLSPDCQSVTELDPLMGCAQTLFPIIGRVANLVRRVRCSESNSPPVISQAIEFKEMLESWQPPHLRWEDPEDPSLDVQHSIQTAEAYRWATLLYLHQAVPEIPSEPSGDLAKRVLVFLATVPLSSRAVIVHIYPLLAAGCEATDPETRQWVCDRWNCMAQRMKIGVIDRCAEIVQEVWDRRDAYEAGNRDGLKRSMTREESPVEEIVGWCNFGTPKRRANCSAYDLPNPIRVPGSRKRSADAMTGALDPNFTVRGNLHWIGVMKDWRWEEGPLPPSSPSPNTTPPNTPRSEPHDPTSPISAGFYRLESGTPLVYTYTYHEMKIIVDGEFDISDESGKKVHATKGDVFYFEKGSTITFTTESFGLGFYVGQRREGGA
ncbi:hypothetical protein M501DRAFT_1023954 [Patellaria atrata CBS 101060]|uniref:Zn(2)-C6 fungal-type domain-containing protein n=1 Tax=Patellaria atrata CBS 101060 TaxID=1346257 RepID=A0A9P4SDW2_9PEZI|nr:hypothetical protein M501DRAFT_1023954 [Patellaria atrata CBS 101060]